MPATSAATGLSAHAQVEAIEDPARDKLLPALELRRFKPPVLIRVQLGKEVQLERIQPQLQMQVIGIGRDGEIADRQGMRAGAASQGRQRQPDQERPARVAQQICHKQFIPPSRRRCGFDQGQRAVPGRSGDAAEATAVNRATTGGFP